MPYPRENNKTVSGSATNASAIATLPAPGTSSRWRVKAILAGYGAAPTAGSVTITDGANVNIVLPLGANPLAASALDIQCGPNQPVTATLAAGGAAIVGGVTLIGAIEG